MDTVCWCNDCHARRFRFGEQDRRKFDDCIAQKALDYAYECNAERGKVSADQVVERNRKLLLERSNVGISKYGVTLAGAGLSKRALLQHALEEALDLANYLQAEIMRLDGEIKENG